MEVVVFEVGIDRQVIVQWQNNCIIISEVLLFEFSSCHCHNYKPFLEVN
jgi:hypothetical protein